MKLTKGREQGQALVEFAIIFVVLMMLTTGLVDVGRAFYQYNALSSAARFGARWAAVVGGVCTLSGQNSTGWCTQQGTSTSNFWSQNGNVPLQGYNAECPPYSQAPGDYYLASDPDHEVPPDNDYSSGGNGDGDAVANSTTIVGSIDQHFDSSSSSSGFVVGAIGGFDLTQLAVCIQATAAPVTAPALPSPAAGDYVRVVLHYHFNPVSFILARSSFNLDSSSEYEIQG